MPNNYKPSYRKQKTVLNTSTKVIIALLVVLVLTLSAFLIKVIVGNALKPDITYPPEQSGPLTDAPQTDAEETETDESVRVRALESSKFDVKSGSLLLVNKTTGYTLPASAELVNLYDSRHDNFTLATVSERLAPEAYEALCRMTDACAERTGYCPIMVTSSYRDIDAQQKYYDDYVVNESDKAYVELPGFSDHHTGLGFDVKIYDRDGASYGFGRYAAEKVPWILENYKYYGFIIRYPANKGDFTGIDGESNHFRYVGLPHSVYITENNICLEEYLTAVKRYTQEKPLEITVDHDEYAVWYCKGDTVYVPYDGDYEVSGDNAGGFIVTVRK